MEGSWLPEALEESLAPRHLSIRSALSPGDRSRLTAYCRRGELSWPSGWSASIAATRRITPRPRISTIQLRARRLRSDQQRARRAQAPDPGQLYAAGRQHRERNMSGAACPAGPDPGERQHRPHARRREVRATIRATSSRPYAPLVDPPGCHPRDRRSEGRVRLYSMPRQVGRPGEARRRALSQVIERQPTAEEIAIALGQPSSASSACSRRRAARSRLRRRSARMASIPWATSCRTTICRRRPRFASQQLLRRRPGARARAPQRA